MQGHKKPKTLINKSKILASFKLPSLQTCFFFNKINVLSQVGQADIIDLDGGDIYDYRNEISVVAAENVGYEGKLQFIILLMK